MQVMTNAFVLVVAALVRGVGGQVALYEGADSHKVIISNTGSEDLGFYYLGNGYDQGRDLASWDGSETLNVRDAESDSC